MAGIYSTRFLLENGGGSTEQQYTVPAGRVAILDTFDFVATVAGVEALLITNGSTWWGDMSSFATGKTVYSGQWRGRHVLQPGDVLTAVITGAGGFQGSGYLLNDLS